MFSNKPGAVRDAIPTADEGDALLDMLFDDATRPSEPEAPPPASAEVTPIPGADDAHRRPTPVTPIPGEHAIAEEPQIVTPPGWATSGPQSPSPPRANSPRPAAAAPRRDFDNEQEDQPTRVFAGGAEELEALSRRESAFPVEDAPAIEDDDDDDGGATMIGSAVAVVSGPAPIPAADIDLDGEVDLDEAGLDLAELSLHPADLGIEAVDSVPPRAPPPPRRERLASEVTFDAVQDVASAPPPEAYADAPPLGSLDGRPLTVSPRAPLPSSAFAEEHDAASILARKPELRQAMIDRAAWMREEANLRTDKLEKARLMLVVSELCALVGEDDAAASAAHQAHQLAPSLPLTIRQHRSMITRTGDFARASEVIEAEIRHMPTPEGRAHAAWLASEAARLASAQQGGGDEALAQKRSDQALRASPSDPRPCVQRFARAMMQGTEPSALVKLKSSDPEGLAALDAAFMQVAGLRSFGETTLAKRAPTRHVAEALLAGRAAIGRGDRVQLVTALQHLGRSSLASSVAWLSGSVLAARDETRRESSTAYRAAAEGTAASLARRALAAVSIELGESVDPRDPDAFSPADRVALATLDACQPGPQGVAARGALTSVLDEAAVEGGSSEEAADVALLAGAAVAAALPPGEQRLARLRYSSAGSASSRAAAQMARVLGSAAKTDGAGAAQYRATLDEALTELLSTADPGATDRAALGRALALELDIDAGAHERIAQSIATWGSDGESGADTSAMLATALLAEVSGQHEEARQTYAAIHKEEPVHEITARASTIDPAELATVLREHADTLPVGLPKAMLLTECAVRWSILASQAEDDDATAFAESADAAAKAAAELVSQGVPPTFLPLAVHVGELSSRARADQPALLEWLRFRREATTDALERAHDLTREALLVSDGESDVAASLLEEALRARPADFALRDLLERLSPEPPADRASWREARAMETSGPDAARLAIEAAHEYERAADLEAAARCTKLAEANGDKDLAAVASYRLALAGFGTAEVVDALLPQAREIEDATARLEIYERLAELDERGRGDTASGLLFRRTILEENPAHIRTLRRVASALMLGNREDEFEPVAMELARNLEGGEAVAYAAVAARLRLRTRWEDTAEPVAIAFAQEPRPLWAIRQMAAHARARGDHAVAAICDRELAGLTERPIEKATLLTRAAEAHRAANELASARHCLEEALTHFDGHIVARESLAALLTTTGDAEAAAAHLEMLAGTLLVPAARAEADHRAAVLYQDQVGDVARARAALERVLDLDPHFSDTFDRLRTIYIAAGARSELADLLKRRLEGIQDPGERVEMEVMRGRALAEVGDADAAKRALAAALDANPDHVEALAAFAELCAADGDYGGAEEALIRLARLTSEPDKQVDIYFRLGALYDENLPNDERAEAAYQEILKRRPTDGPARERLIALYRRTGQMPRAVDEQNALVNAAESPDDKCQRTVELAEIMEEMGEIKKAESTLVVARKSFPKSDLALRALVQFYQRTGQGPAAAVLLDRAVADARRALGTGRFENFLFETLATAAELRGRLDAAAVARATVQALDGESCDLAGVGLRAGDAKLDDLLAPDVMTPAFRDLLIRTGALLDNAFPFDTDAVRATPLPPPLASLGEEVRAMAGAYGLPQIMVMVSNVLGSVCVPVRSHPPTLLIGSALAQQPASAERSFLFHRAMKVIQANACVLARTAPIDLWPVLAALLKAFSPQFQPQGVDSGRFADAFGRISRAMPQGLGADMGMLASDVVGTIGNRASTLNSAINGWGSRAGLLAVGDPNVVLTGIAWAGGNVSGPPAGGKDRVTWIGRNAEARDLVIFAVSDHYVDARQRLGA